MQNIFLHGQRYRMQKGNWFREVPPIDIPFWGNKPGVSKSFLFQKENRSGP